MYVFVDCIRTVRKYTIRSTEDSCICSPLTLYQNCKEHHKANREFMCIYILHYRPCYMHYCSSEYMPHYMLYYMPYYIPYYIPYYMSHYITILFITCSIIPSNISHIIAPIISHIKCRIMYCINPLLYTWLCALWYTYPMCPIINAGIYHMICPMI